MSNRVRTKANAQPPVHHKIARQYGWTNHFDNKITLKRIEHQWLHNYHWNNLPHESILQILDDTWRAFNNVFRDNLNNLIQEYDIEEIYNEKCLDLNKHYKQLASWIIVPY